MNSNIDRKSEYQDVLDSILEFVEVYQVGDSTTEFLKSALYNLD